jgi:hypothetical protein
MAALIWWEGGHRETNFYTKSPNRPFRHRFFYNCMKFKKIFKGFFGNESSKIYYFIFENLEKLV